MTVLQAASFLIELYIFPLKVDYWLTLAASVVCLAVWPSGMS